MLLMTHVQDPEYSKRSSTLGPAHLQVNHTSCRIGKTMLSNMEKAKDDFLTLTETLSHRNTMAWCLFAISTNPEVEERVLAELDTLGLLAKPGYPEPRSLEVSDLGKLPYLNAAIKEAMRLHTVRARGVITP